MYTYLHIQNLNKQFIYNNILQNVFFKKKSHSLVTSTKKTSSGYLKLKFQTSHCLS